MISRDTKLFRYARWAYQPVKQANILAKQLVSDRSRKRVISDYLSRPGFKGLQIGSGTHRRVGWLNSDIAGTPGIDIALDIEKKLPFQNEALNAIYGSEVIEHIPRESVPVFLTEAHRVLRKDGVIRLTTPDVKAICEIYLGLNDYASLKEIEATWLEPEFSPHYWINSMFRSWGHQWLWNFEALSEVAKSAGFAKTECLEPQVTGSQIPELENLETRYGTPAPPHCWVGSFILEATK
jgi:predicted SAM-dependent methyltransferase